MKTALSTIAYYTPVKHGKSEQIQYALETIIITDRQGAHDFTKATGKEYNSIFELQQAVYHIARNNGYKIKYHTDFGTIWYDIILLSENGYTSKHPISIHLQSIFEQS